MDLPASRKGTQRSARIVSFNMITSRILPATLTVITKARFLVKKFQQDGAITVAIQVFNHKKIL